MNCRETQKNISLFLEKKLELEQLEEFLEHIECCNDCKEELEVYYTLYTAMRILEEDTNYKNISYKIDLKRELERAKEKCRRAKRKKMHKSLLLYILIMLIGIFVI